jgi:hypothetical protein
MCLSPLSRSANRSSLSLNLRILLRNGVTFGRERTRFKWR